MTADRRDPQAHLDLLELDALRAGEPLPAAATAHAAWCADCASELDALHDLASALRGAEATPIAAAHLDARVHALAATHAARVRRSRWRAGSTAAAAAAVAVFAMAVLWRDPLRRAAAPPAEVASASAPRAELAMRDAALADDLDGDGRITVLDAFALARAGAADPPRIDAVVAMAVSLQANP